MSHYLSTRVNSQNDFCCFLQEGVIFGKFLELNKSIKILINYGLSPLLFLWLLWSSYHQLMKQDDLHTQWQIFLATVMGKDSWKIIVAAILIFVNWGIEAIKWRQIISPVQELTFFQALNATLAGVAFALNTPNRVGEYGARILFVEEGKRVRAIPLTIVSSMSQFAVTMLAGFIAICLMYEKLNQAFGWAQNPSRIIFAIFIILLLTIITLLLYFRIAGIMERLLRISFVKRLSQYFNEIKDLSGAILWSSFGLSICRFGVFIIQYMLLLQVMHVEIPFWDSIGIISILFLCLTLIPTIALLELGIRWELGVLLFGIYSHNVLGIYLVASAIWVFNLLIPSILGSLSILRIRIFKLKE